MVQLFRPEVIIETGTNVGYSTARLAHGLQSYSKTGMIYTFDIGDACHLFEGTELPQNISFILGSSLDADFDESIVADMLVLDSDHSYDTIIKEILRFEPQLKVGGLMLLHDSIYFDGVAHAAIELMRSPRFEVVTLPTPRTHGMGTRPPGLTIVRKCLPTPTPNDLVFRDDLRGIEVGRDGMDTESIIDKIYYRNGSEIMRRNWLNKCVDGLSHSL